MKLRSLGCALLALGLLGSGQTASAATEAACTWKPTVLAAGTSVSAQVTATDDKGGFAGWTRPAGSAGTRAAAWTGGGYTDLGVARAMNPRVTAENRAGAVAGTARTSISGYVVEKAFKSSGGGLVELPLPASGGYARSDAVGITDSGDVIGTVAKQDGTGRIAARWPATQPDSVTLLPGAPSSGVGPVAVDTDGTIVLNSSDLWRDGTLTHLGTLPGLEFKWPEAIKNGRVVGYGVYNGKNVGVYWDQQHAAHVLPKSSYNLSTANPGFSINAAGLITGRIDNANGGNDSAGTGYGVWNQGTFVAKFGDLAADLPVVIGDDGTAGGYRYDSTTENSTAYSWRCS
ncbi:hypothetical protein SAMN05421837_109240 [Amycolatopsis pretoriensis]|uniref:Extracellular repeat, HAF family n=1 Tax=Amycolatopsis pretoriensis TaxID=218821 RepID=A0A1H5RCI2_9PSEU|nr:hypothetical protein [Amycolatopsis pretoriensis]SEF36083.1 hypothetical protein SAMN05421837_109240 [Amycolatopsis pretoriensis]